MLNIDMFTQKLIINAKLTNLNPRTYKTVTNSMIIENNYFFKLFYILLIKMK